MILSEGITERARNDIVRNGVPPDQPSAVAASLQARALRDDIGQRRVGEKARHRERALRHDPTAAELQQAPDDSDHVVVGHAQHDDVVRIVRDRRAERAPLEPSAQDEIESEPTRRQVPLDDSDLRETTRRIGHCARPRVKVWYR